MSAEHRRPRHELDHAAIHECVMKLVDACRAALDVLLDDPSAVRAAGRTLGIDKSLASKLLRVADATDPFEAIRVMPGPRGWSQVLTALASADEGGATSIVVREAIATLQTELSDRGLSMNHLRSTQTQSHPEITFTDARGINPLRNNLTRTHAQVWGISGTAFLRSFVVWPTEVPDRLRLGVVTTVQGVHRTTPGPDWPIHDLLNRRDDAEDGTSTAEPWPGSVDCSDLYDSERVGETGILKNRTGAFRTFRGFGSGPSDRIDLGFIEIATDPLPLHGGDAPELTGFEIPVLLPTPVAVIDAFVDRDGPLASTPRIQMFIEAGGIRLSRSNRAHHALPTTEHAESRHSAVASDLIEPDAPEIKPEIRTLHATAVTRAMSSLGLAPESLVRHRVRLNDPILSTSIRMSWPS
ncbi:MAG: hypothetical protein P8J88_03265 [Phycisphaerales bacterium]|nr:hypothetical protein [Phycisphaerales bacterium]MDG1977624.1 hypothetical protein [Phycisphaerales bacterium]MDG2132489.1 hypothetical protein [Phycisphaerales bacterium]